MTQAPKDINGRLPYKDAYTGNAMFRQYDKDAVYLGEETIASAMPGPDGQHYVSPRQPLAGSSSFTTMVRAHISSRGRRKLMIESMAGKQSLLSSGQGRYIIVKPLADGSLELYCMFPGLFNSQSGCNVDFSSDESVRQYLKTVFAGWHHVYHEAFAIARQCCLVTLNPLDLLRS